MTNKILVVDDDPAARTVLARLLHENGLIFEAATGDEALRIIEAERPRLMLLDMVMPGMSGLDVLKARQTSVAAMVILVVTGRSDIELAKEALRFGALEYITKPFDLPRLKDKVTRCLAAPEDKRPDAGLPWRVVGELH